MLDSQNSKLSYHGFLCFDIVVVTCKSINGKMSWALDLFVVVVYSFSLSNDINDFYGDTVLRSSMDTMQWCN